MEKRATLIIAAILNLALTMAPAERTKPLSDDFYPPEEAAERSTIMLPRFVDLTKDGAQLEWPKEFPQILVVGQRHREWELVGIIPQPTPLAVLQRSFPRWGVLVFIGKNGPVTTIRKAIGDLESLHREKDFPPEYFDSILSARSDLLGKQFLATRNDPSYASLAGLLPPLRGYTFLGTPMSQQKVIVWQDGRLGLGVHNRRLDTVLFDPASILRIASSASIATKQGLVGRYLPVIDYGFFDAEENSGWEEVAFSVGQKQLKTYVCLRPNGGEPTYWELPGPRPLPDGTAFYRELLGVQQKWVQFFAEGMELQVPEDRVADASKAAIVRALISEVGIHPKYGVGRYAEDEHDGFPPTTIQLNLCLLDWGFFGEAKERLGYYLSNFVKNDGTVDYYGPAISEYGQILTLAVKYVRTTDDTEWLAQHLPQLRKIAGYLIGQINASRNKYPPSSLYYGLLWGAAEADTSSDKRFYFSSDAWCWRGLMDFGQLLRDEGSRRKDAALEQLGSKWVDDVSVFQGNVLAALQRSFQNDIDSPFLPPVAGGIKPFERMTETEFASYTNYRYWIEMLSSGMLTPAMSNAIIAYRTSHGGEVGAATRFEDHLDNWTYANYAWGLLDAKEPDHYLLGFYGHLSFHETPGTFTAYESVAIKGDRTREYGTDYCVPSEVVIPQMLKWMIAWESADKQELWLTSAIPKKWLQLGFSAHRVPTRWGFLSLEERPTNKGLTMKVELVKAHPELTVYIPVRSVISGTTPTVRVEGTNDWEWDAKHQAVKFWGPWNRVTVTVG